jgi:hypothetical protein
MGARLLDYYEKVTKEYGVKGRMKLALLTSVTSMTAANEADSPAIIKKFEEAMAQIKKSGIG